MTDSPKYSDQTDDSLYSDISTDILHRTRLGTWEWSQQTGMCRCDAPFFEEFGDTAEMLQALTFEQWKERIHPDEHAAVFQHFQDVVSGRASVYDCVYRFQTVVEKWIWIHSRGSVAERDANGRATRIIGFIQDVTQFKEPEEIFLRRDRLMTVSNEIAQLLVDAPAEDFDRQLWHVLHLLGTASNVDRVYIWRNYYNDDGELYTTQEHEWSLGAEPQQGNALTVGIPFKSAAPMWGKTLAAGQCINSLVRDLPEIERNHLAAQHIISILVAPIIFKGEFWGFIGFDDCKHERTWSEPEIAVLKSTATLITAAINRRGMEEVIATERKALKTIFDSSPIGVVITTDGLVRRCNSRFIDLFQIDVGDSMREMYLSSDVHDELLDELHEKGIVFNRMLTMQKKDGTLHDLLMTLRKIDYEGKPSLLCWLVDITDLKKTEKELMLARDLAEAGTKAKSEFLARMSHEIRTPMNAILGMNYLCLQTDLTEKQKDYLLKTQTATLNLLGIIDDILDFSKIESGKLELEKTAFHLSGLIDEVIDVIEYKAQEKELRLSVNIAETVHDELIGDPLRLRQILTNLLNNAVKFTERGSIQLLVAIEKETAVNIEDHPLESPEICLSFLIKDTGIGMTSEQIGRLFESFSQADGSTTRKYGGTGLGLVIAKNLVELMGGRIGVDSVPGKGTAFRFTARFQKADISSNTETIDFSRRRVLVIDDDPVTRELIKEFVLSFGMRIETAENGIAGIAALNRATHEGDPFEVALIDWKMPRMDGIETIRQIRSSQEIEVPPQILMISAYDRNECLRQTRNLGISGFLIKPFTRKALQESLQSTIAKEQPEAAAEFPEQETNIRGSRVLLVEDNKVNQIVASELLHLAGVDVTVANNGIEAIEAVKNADFDLILMDVQMPVMDGLEAARTIRRLNKPGIDKLPILAMTANAMESDYRKSLDAGMDDHLTKPIDPEKLRRALETWIVRPESDR